MATYGSIFTSCISRKAQSCCLEDEKCDDSHGERHGKECNGMMLGKSGRGTRIFGMKMGERVELEVILYGVSSMANINIRLAGGCQPNCG